jgi:hypothetical protein
MVLLGDEAQVEAQFSPFGDSANLDARQVIRLKWMLISFHLETVLILTQDNCTVYAKHTIGSEIILDTPDGTPW